MCNRRAGHFRIRKLRDEQFRTVLHQLRQWEPSAVLRSAHLQGKPILDILFFYTWATAESIEWFIENQAFSQSYDAAPPPPTPSPSPVTKLDRQHTGRLRKRDNWWKGEGWRNRWTWNQIIRQRESLVLYKSFDILCSTGRLETKLRYFFLIFYFFLKGTQDWEFFWLRIWIFYYFIVSSA